MNIDILRLGGLASIATLLGTALVGCIAPSAGEDTSDTQDELHRAHRQSGGGTTDAGPVDSGTSGSKDSGSTDAGAPACTPLGPSTPRHYAPNANIDATGKFVPGGDGFNVADVGSPDELAALPDGVLGLVYLGVCNGADASFVSMMQGYAGSTRVLAFFLVDEPDPTGQWHPLCPAANLKAESDWIHTNLHQKTFITMMNFGDSANPTYANTYDPTSSSIDLYGLDPYPCRTDLNGCDDSMITKAVTAAESSGIPLSAIVPVYQTFGGGGWTDDSGGAYLLPTAAQETEILSTWAKVVPTPPFDFAYSWGSQNGDTALGQSAELQQVFAAHNASACTTPTAPAADAGGTTSGGGTTTGSSSPPGVMVILMENHGYHDLIGNSQAPYINQLASGFASATAWTDVTHPSLPNYLALTAGNAFGSPSDCAPTWAAPTGGCTFDTSATSLADQLSGAGIPWKAYIEDMPTACDTSDAFGPGNYDVNHNPFMYYDHVVQTPSECGRVVPYGQLATDLAGGSLPSFIWVTPNVIHDMHNGTITDGDTFLQGLIPSIQASSWYAQGGRIVLTWDEGETEEQIVTIVVSKAMAGHGAFATPGNHYGTLRAIEELYGLPLLGNAGNATNGDLRPLL
jgi:hypothetical protein